MAPETPPNRGVSSRLLTMKFMQRAAASESPAGTPPSEEPSSKRRKIQNSPLTGEFHSVDQTSIQAALKAQEAVRRAALEKHTNTLADTHWVLDDPWASANNANTDSPPSIVYIGYADIDAAEDGWKDQAQAGRRKVGNQKSEDGQKPDENSISDDNSDSSGDSSAESTSPSSKAGASATRRSSAGKERSRAHRSSKKTAESSKARDFRDKRIKKEVKLNKLSSISGGDSTRRWSSSNQGIICHACQQPGHKERDCPTSGRKRKSFHQS